MKILLILVIISLSLYLLINKINFISKIEYFEGNKRPATIEDIQKGLTYSLYRKCINNGYYGNLTSDTSFDCEHTRDTCLRDSKEDNPFNYYIWKDETCQIGNLNFKKFCKKENLDYTEDGECKTNKKYCESKKEKWNGSDCEIILHFYEKLDIE